MLGHALSLSREPLEFLRASARKYGDLVSLQFFWKRILFVNHPDYVGQVLAMNHGNVRKGLTRRVDRALLGSGLSLREGDLWLRERRIMQPPFHRERMAAYGDVVVDAAQQMLERWHDGDTPDIYTEIRKLTLAIVAQTLFGIDPSNDAGGLVEALATAVTCRDARMRGFQPLLPDSLPTPTNLRIRRVRHRIDAMLHEILQRRRTDGDNRDDLLAVLLRARDEAGHELTDQQVKDEVMTVFIGGNETVTDLLSWIWFLLSQYPDVESRLLTEVDAVIGDRSPTVADLPRLMYAGMIVAETLRLYPPAPVLDRETIKDVTIGGHRVAPGTAIVVSPWVMQRDPRYFADPDVFNPDRWADGLAGRLPPYAYFPFGGGPRLCIGKSFATIEATLLLVSVAQRYRLALVPGQRVVPEPIPTLHPKFGLPMVLQRREGTAVRR